MFAVRKRRAVGRDPDNRPAVPSARPAGPWSARPGILFFLALLSVAFSQPADIEIPYSSVFRESGGWSHDPLRDVRWDTDPVLNLGDDSLRLSGVGFGLGTNLDTPFRLSGPPQDAMFRLWKLYIDIPSTYVEVIASDNADQTKHDREKGVIAVVSTSFDLTLQLTERLQLNAGGSYIYLPFKNTGGFQGGGLFADSFAADADLDADVDLFLEASFDGKVGEWDFYVSDRIGIESRDTALNSFASYDARLHYLDTGDFDKADRLGRYSLGGGHYDDDEDPDNDIDEDSDSDSRWEFETGGKYNRFSLGFARDLPTDTRMSVTLFRNDTWDGKEDQDEGHDWTHGVNLSLYNQHYSMRFRPYFTYTASTSKDSAWDHVARVGFAGPITDYTSINANVGRTWETGRRSTNSRSTLWHVSIHNELNELTTHRLSYTRSVEEPNDEIHTTLAYSIHRVLGPHLDGSLFASWVEEDESDGSGDGHSETTYNLGASLSWDASSRLNLRLTGFVTAVQEEDTPSDYEEYRIRLAANYTMTDTVSLHLSYEYIRRDDERTDQSFFENVARARLTKQW